MIQLSKAEREAFFQYCVEVAQSNRELVDQMDRLPALNKVKERYKRLAIAYTLVAHDLNMTEEQEIT